MSELLEANNKMGHKISELKDALRKIRASLMDLGDGSGCFCRERVGGPGNRRHTDTCQRAQQALKIANACL